MAQRVVASLFNTRRHQTRTSTMLQPLPPIFRACAPFDDDEWHPLGSVRPTFALVLLPLDDRGNGGGVDKRNSMQGFGWMATALASMYLVSNVPSFASCAVMIRDRAQPLSLLRSVHRRGAF